MTSSPFKKNDVIIMDSSKIQYLVINPCCKDSWLRKLLGKSSIAGYVKVKRYRPGFWKRFKIRMNIIHWKMFELDAERYFYPRTNDKTYLKLARMARIKIIKLKKELKLLIILNYSNPLSNSPTPVTVTSYSFLNGARITQGWRRI